MRDLPTELVVLRRLPGGRFGARDEAVRRGRAVDAGTGHYRRGFEEFGARLVVGPEQGLDRRAQRGLADALALEKSRASAGLWQFNGGIKHRLLA